MVLELGWVRLLLWIFFSCRCVRRLTGCGITSLSLRSLLVLSCHAVGSASPEASHPVPPITLMAPHRESALLAEVCGLMG